MGRVSVISTLLEGKEYLRVPSGEYQYEIYRMMRLVHTGRSWSDFKPLTNVMVSTPLHTHHFTLPLRPVLTLPPQWLHYLVRQLLTKKGLKEPSRRTPSPTTQPGVFSEMECYKALVDIEEWLGRCVAEVVASAKKQHAAPTRTRKSMAVKRAGRASPVTGMKGQTAISPSITPACAGEVVAYGVKKGWIQPVGQ